ncbi:MAG: 30S ribosomal protein S6 [Planctomycetales bacterium]|nr:30S ribosomal protein S6 [Planctomycetales bacterium]NIM09129.1 30S ribosomal protein S6 [Planctomycetales bacterium]NIN08596.1 30S ribosomal protein S6 [Planctomycetales bacterium]NIN77722.1 30S ribosomal protein S6 [Planctomycetales bacterium]NIO34894.1 30S ribosomal protein S6 [Planctomycetales bacterium]
MAINVYEGLFILDASRYSRDAAGTAGRIDKLLKKHGGQILASRLWDERRLAYPINGQRKGVYWLTYFRLEGRQLAAVTEEYQRDDNILRQLFLKVDPRIVDQLVRHATQREAREKPADTPPQESPEKSTESSSAAATPA